MQRNVVIAVLGGIFLVFSWLANLSLRKLSYKSSSYYDFGRVFPHSGRWAITVYLVGIFILLAIFLFFAQLQGFITITPA